MLRRGALLVITWLGLVLVVGWVGCGCGGCSTRCTPPCTAPPRTRWSSTCSPSHLRPSSPGSGNLDVHTDRAPSACSRGCCGSCRGTSCCRSGDWWRLLPAGREALDRRRPLDLDRADPSTTGARATCFLCHPVAEVTDGSLADFRRRYHLEFRVPQPGKWQWC